MREKERQTHVLIGLAMLGGTIAGTVSLIAAILPLILGEFLAAGACLASASLSFGLVANAMLRQ